MQTGEAMNDTPNLVKLTPSPEMTIYQCQLGPYANLNHLIICNETNYGAIVDPFSGNYWIKVIDELNIDSSQFEFQVLYGVPMGGWLERHLRNNYNVRIYVPFGEDWYDYSIRRLRENPAIAGYIIKNMFKQ